MRPPTDRYSIPLYSGSYTHTHRHKQFESKIYQSTDSNQPAFTIPSIVIDNAAWYGATQMHDVCMCIAVRNKVSLFIMLSTFAINLGENEKMKKWKKGFPFLLVKSRASVSYELILI